MAESRQSHREQGKVMFEASISVGSLTSLVLARERMATHSCGFCRTISRNNVLVTENAHLKWRQVSMMSSTTVNNTIDVLRLMFAAYGLTDQINSDNGPQFFSDDFVTLTKLMESNMSGVQLIIQHQTVYRSVLFSC